METITGKLENLQRMPSSINGNPRYSCTIAGAYCQTAPDSSEGYMIANYQDKPVIAQIRQYYGKPTISTLNPLNEVK